MGTKVKGSIMKGFKYISNIFDDKEEEEEMQIGAPTDVKHVAHIGMDDTSATKPSWMEEYKAAPELAPQSNPSSEARSVSYDSQEDSKKPPKDSKHTRRGRGSSDKNKDKDSSSSNHRFRRRSKESNNLESTSEESAAAVVPKHSRKKKTKGSSSSAAGGEGSTKSSKGDHSTSKSLPDSTLPAFPDNIAAGGSGPANARRRGTKSNETPSTVLEVYD